MISYSEILENSTVNIHARSESHIFFSADERYFLIYNDGATKCFDFETMSDLGSGKLAEKLYPYINIQNIDDNGYEKSSLAIIQSNLSVEIGKAFRLINPTKVHENNEKLNIDQNLINLINIQNTIKINYSLFFRKWVFVSSTNTVLFDEFNTIHLSRNPLVFNSELDRSKKYFNMITFLQHQLLSDQESRIEINSLLDGNIYVNNSYHEMKMLLESHLAHMKGWIKHTPIDNRKEILIDFPFEKAIKFNNDVQFELIKLNNNNSIYKSTIHILPGSRLSDNTRQTIIRFTENFETLRILNELFLKKINNSIITINLSDPAASTYDQQTIKNMTSLDEDLPEECYS